jgi:hypothetical protein
MWNDPYESFIFAAMRSDEGRSRITKWLGKRQRPEDVGASLAVLSIFETAYFGQCWTALPESDALWRIYSHESMSVRIEVDADDIRKIDELIMEEVRYVPKLDLDTELSLVFDSNTRTLKAHKTFFVKRDAFAHEVRLLTKPDLQSMVAHSRPTPPTATKSDMDRLLQGLVQNGSMTSEQASAVIQQIYDNSSPSSTKYVSFAHIPGFIRSVMLNPLAPYWLEETMNQFCIEKSIKFLGKSRMYSFEV